MGYRVALPKKKETIFGGGMKKKPEKSSSGLINNSGLAKNIKSENRGRLFLTLNYFLLYQAILFIHFFF